MGAELQLHATAVYNCAGTGEGDVEHEPGSFSQRQWRRDYGCGNVRRQQLAVARRPEFGDKLRQAKFDAQTGVSDCGLVWSFVNSLSR